MRGRSCFRLEVIKVGSGIRIGVSKRKGKENLHFGDTETSWALDSLHGEIGHSGRWNKFGSNLKKGDIIYVGINRELGWLIFKIAGKFTGRAFHSLMLKRLVLFPAITLYEGAQVRFVNPKTDEQESKEKTKKR